MSHVKIHAFVLMANHVHLLASGEDKFSISCMMQALGRSFVHYINTTYQRTGTLWEGRYKSSLVSTTDYLFTLSRYIELNPVRAGMVTLPGEYPWSSYRPNGMGITIGLISEHEVYRGLARTKSGRVHAYRELFKGQLSTEPIEEIRISTNKGWVIGSEGFRREIETAIGRKVAKMAWGGDRTSSVFKQTEESSNLTP